MENRSAVTMSVLPAATCLIDFEAETTDGRKKAPSRAYKPLICARRRPTSLSWVALSISPWENETDEFLTKPETANIQAWDPA